MTSIGAPLDRVDGPLKVCGQAHYTGDLSVPRMAHAVLVTSTIASGRIARIDAAAAERAPGVVAVITLVNAMKLPNGGKLAGPDGRVLSLLQDDQVAYSNQPIALVVAETFEQANGAAALVRVTYARATACRWSSASCPRTRRSPSSTRCRTAASRGSRSRRSRRRAPSPRWPTPRS